jgi:hypothetical protein
MIVTKARRWPQYDRAPAMFDYDATNILRRISKADRKSAKEPFTGFESNAYLDVDNYPAAAAFSIST